MEKILKLYTYVDGVNDTPFPSEKHQVVTSDFRSDYKRMGAVPTISCTIMHPLCLDKLWTENVYAEFKGEKFFIKQTATSSYDNTDSRYKHEVELVSERIILDNVYVFDVVTNDVENDKPVSNSTKFTFFGTIHELAERLNHSLQYSKLDYRVIVDDGVTSEGKLISFENQFFSNALQESYNTYKIPYYFVGKDIHIGFTNNAITKTFKYGVDESLLSIQKNNANAKIVNRITGVGSAENIPYYYPNNDEKGETRLLYNGEVGGVSINNVARYKKVKLGDVFSYKVDEGGTTPLWVLDEYNLSEPYYWGQEVDDFGEVIDGVYLYNVNFSYSFPIDIHTYVNFEVNTYPVGYPYDMELKEFNVQLTEDTRGLIGTYYKSFSEALGQGTYVLQVHAVMRLSYKPEEILLSDFKEIINIGFFINATYDKETKKTWYLNGTKVSLDSYGITITNTPKDGDKITLEQVSYLMPQENLMPTIYRESEGKERFYNALNETYISPQTNDYYQFENPYVDGKPKEHFINFEEIKPTIVGITNAGSQRIDMFSEFAYDENDNDEMDEEGNYIHPYFFGKLRRFDGDYGFNLFEHAIDEGEMTISMTSGNCGGCEWVIGVDEDTQKNIVQVNEYGNLLRDDNGNVKLGSPQERQNDTSKYEVWVALKKDINTFGVIMPNATNNYKPNTEDTFVILHIDLPKAYILAAEKKLEEELIKYMAINNSEKFNFSISFSRIFFAENPDILEQLNENARIQIEYDNTLYELYVSSYSYNMSNDKPLPEIKVELSDTLTVSQNAIQNAVDSVKHDIMSSVGSIDFLKQGLRYFIRKDVDDRAKGKISTDKAFEVGEYVSGSSGAIIYKDPITGQTIGEMDKLYVRMKAYFETLEIINAQSIGGKQIISPVGSVACVGVEELDNSYRCYFLAEQDGEVVQNRWQVNDQAYSQMFNANIGVTNKVSNHYYWRLVTNVSDSLIEYNEKKCHYIDLSKTDMDKNSDVPKVGDIINQRGSRTDIDRMNFVETSSIDAFSPSVTLYHGVNSFSLAGKDYVQFGVDKTTNKAFMNVYGDMYVGDRNKTAYMRYTQEEGLVICGKLDVGTKLGDAYLKDLISASTPEGYQEFVEKVTQDLEGLQAQIDGTIDSYFFQYDPSLTVYPASEWIKIDNENGNNNQKDAHLNDTFTNIASDSGRSWRWVKDPNTGNYFWSEITDTATTKALALAGKAQDTADGKRRVFVVTDEHPTPYPPYDKGDLWSRGSDYPLLICVVPKESGVYAEGDFDYADNNAKLKEEMQTLVTDTKSELNNSIGQAKEAANKYADEGIASAKEDINASIAELEEAKANVTEVYSKSEADGKITEAETSAINAAKAQADAAIALSEATIKAYADGIVDDEEAARIKQAQENLAEAKRYAEEQAEAAKSEIENSYLFQALQDAQSTEIENGLVLTSLIQLRDTQSNIMSGINGLINASKGDKSIATWWGGGMYDLIDYYRWDGSQWVVKSGITAPSNIPSGLIRMDGTGYLAKGKFWWDNDGKIYADPTALFLSFDVDAEEGTLSATILDIRDKQTEFANMWSLQTDSNGTQYLYSKYPLVSQGGVTMYAGTSGLDVEGIYDGLPIDGSTIYWENGVLKAQGGGGGVADSVAWADITGKPSFATVATSGSYNDLLNKPTLLSSFTNDLGFVTESALSGKYLPLSGGLMGGAIQWGSASSPVSINASSGYLSFDSIGKEICIAAGSDTAININYRKTAYGYAPTNWIIRAGSATSYANIYAGNLYSNDYSVLTSGNYSSYALPLTGGTLTGKLTINTSSYGDQLEIYRNQANGNSAIRFSNSEKVLGDIGVCGSGGEYPYQPFFTDRTTNIMSKIYHSGNSNLSSVDWNASKLILNTTNTTDWNVARANNTIQLLRSGSTMGNAPSTYSSGISIMTSYTGFQLATYGGTGEYLYFRSIQDNNTWHPWKSVAFTDSNVASATKLATARTIWGQSFNGTADVNGILTINSGGYIVAKDGSGNNRDVLELSADNTFYLGYGPAGARGTTYLLGNNIAFRYGTSRTEGMRIDSSGNVGIGTTSPSYKLDVNGTVRVGNNVAGGVLLKFNMDRAWHFYQEGSGSTSALVLQSGTSGKYFHIKNDAGLNVASFYASSDSGNRVGVNGIFEATTIYQNGTALGSAALANSTGTFASVQHSDYNNNQSQLVTRSFISYWNGAYNVNNTSNLKYCYAGTIIGSNNYTAADVLAKLKTVDGSGSGLDADLLDGREGSGYTYHVEGGSSTANIYVKIATLPTSSNSTNDSVTISGTIGTWKSNGKSNLKVSVGKRDGVTFKGYSYPRNGWDIFVNDNGEILIYLTNQYSAWDLSVTCHQATFDYKVGHTPADTNFTKMSNSSYIVWFNDNGSVASATKLQTARTIWGQSFDGTGNVSGDLSGVGNITGSGGITIRSTGSALHLKYDNDDTKSVILNTSSFKPYDAATNKLDLGISSARWNGIYGNTLNLEYSNANLITLKRTASNGGAFVDYYANNQSSKYWRVGGNSVYGFSFTTNQGSGESTPVIILASGNFGIGTTNPSSKLHVVQSEWDNGITIDRSVSGAGASIKVNSNGTYIGNFGINGNKVFEVNLHNGTDIANVLVANNSGNVGIGTTSPSQKLSVKGSIWAEGNGIFNWSPSRCNIYENQIQMFSKSYGGYVIYSGLESGEACRFEVLNSNGGWTSQGWTLFQNGNITMGTTTNYGYKLGVTGSVYITSNLLTGGGITMYSARVLKNVVDERGLSLKELSVIKPTRYTWKDKRDERLHIGGIADDIEQVLPEVVYRTPDGVLTMDYGNAAFAIASSLIKPMIEHESEIVSLKRRVRELEEEVKRLRA